MSKPTKEKLTKKEIALAKVGLIAIIDEATGYQQKRFQDKKALRKIYKNLIFQAPPAPPEKEE